MKFEFDTLNLGILKKVVILGEVGILPRS